MSTASDLSGLEALARVYLERQPWYQTATESAPTAEVVLVSIDVLRGTRPGLARLMLGRAARRFQLVVGWREPSEAANVLRGRESALLGAWSDDEGPVLVYDAMADDELDIALLEHVTEGRERATRVRRVSSLVSHASLVFDERLFMKCYRVLEDGARPEVEVMLRLDEVGFNALLAPMGHWREEGYDLALVREFLPSALEGRLLAMTSLRDLLAHASDSDDVRARLRSADGFETSIEEAADAECASAGGDLASETRRLGATTARLHLALSTAFGDLPASESTFVEAELAMARESAGLGPAQRHELLERKLVRIDPSAAGRTIRLHGDYHLRRVMRSETGWLVAGFSDDPSYVAARENGSLPGRQGSPIEDLADMCYSLRHVADEALAQRPEDESEIARPLAHAWARRNRAAFLDGYTTTDGVQRLLPEDPLVTDQLLARFAITRALRHEATSAEA